MALYPVITVQTGNPDPTLAVNAFLWVMNKIRSLGMVPKTEHTLAEHLLRGDAKIIFYSSAGGIISLVQDQESVDDDDAFEVLEFIMERRKKRAQERRAAAEQAEDDALQQKGAGR